MKIKVNIPTDLSEIRLDKYQKYEASKKNDEDTLSILLDINNVRALPVDAVESLKNDIDKLLTEESKFVRRFILNGVEYGFIPDLEDMTYGEYLDLTEYIGDWDTMHKAMAVLFRPIVNSKKEYYNIKKYNGTGELSKIMRRMPLNIVTGAVFFLVTLQQKLLIVTVSSLVEGMDENQIQDFQKSGGDINSLSHLPKNLEEIFSRLQN